MQQTIMIVSESSDPFELVKADFQHDVLVRYVAVIDQLLGLANDLVPDLIVLDIRPMADSGFDAVTRLKRDLQLHSVPVLVWADQQNGALQALRAGASDVIDAHICTAIIRSRVGNLLALKAKSDQLTVLAEQDSLTGLSNSDGFIDVLDREWRRSLREYNVLAMVLIDIDGFDAFNDSVGASQGDAILKRIAQLIENNCLRAADHVARYDGDQFIALLPGIELANALKVAQNIVRAVYALGIENAASLHDHKLTISAAVVAVEPASERHWQECLNELHDVLAEVKDSGGNQAQGLSI